MISPTMMMETEVDSDTDTIEDNDDAEDRNNIYEEVLNQETYRKRFNHSKLSTTSSIYRNSWWDTNNTAMFNQVKYIREDEYMISLQVHKLNRCKLGYIIYDTFWLSDILYNFIYCLKIDKMQLLIIIQYHYSWLTM